MVHPDSELVVWVDHLAEDTPTLHVGAEVVAMERVPGASASTATIVASGPVELRISGPEGPRRRQLALSRDTDIFGIARQRELLDDANGYDALLAEDRREDAVWLSATARVLLRRQQPLEARQRLQEALAAWTAQDRPVEAANEAVTLAWLALAGPDVLSATEHLLDVDTARVRDLSVLAHVQRQRASWHESTGQLGEAVDQVEAAATMYLAAGDDRGWISAVNTLAELLRRAGRHTESLDAAQAALTRAESQPTPDRCTVSVLQNNLGRLMLAAEQADAMAGWQAPTTAGQLLEASLHPSGAGCPLDERARLDRWLNVGLDGVWRDDLEVAAHALARAETLASAGAAPELLDLAALRAHTSPEPRRALEAWIELADAAWSTDHRARSRRALARHLVVAGTPDAALKMWEEARQAAFEGAWSVPLDLGREAFLSGLRAATRPHVELLLEHGDAAGAMDVVRGLDAWTLTSTSEALLAAGPTSRVWLDAVSAYHQIREQAAERTSRLWEAEDEHQRELLIEEADRAHQEARTRIGKALDGLGTTALPTPPDPDPGELLLTVFDHGDRWSWFSRLAGATHHAWGEPGGGPPPAVLEILGRARLISLLPTPLLQGWDPELDGAPLRAQIPVRWSADLPRRGARTVQRRALVVADARGDLPGAREEARMVTQRLTALGWRVRTLQALDATREAVVTAMEEVDLLHIAGHGERGGAPLSSSILLALDTELTVADVMALPRVPATVVLSGCETAALPHDTSGGFGLARAFVVRGSEAVVATTRAIPDADATVFAEALYGAGLPESDPAEAFRQARLGLAPGRDAGAFRLLVP